MSANHPAPRTTVRSTLPRVWKVVSAQLRAGRARLRMTLGAVVLAVLAMTAVAPAANAWTMDPSVQLTGRAVCVRPGDHPSQVFVLQYRPLRNGQFAHLDRSGRYSIGLPAVPARPGAGVFARVSCEGRGGRYSFDRNFPVARPWWGTAVTHDLIG